MNLLYMLHDWLNRLRSIDFVAPLLLRIYLAPIFWFAGMSKLNNFESTVAWFGNPDWGLGLPYPWLMTFLATAAELGGAVALTFGLALRYAAIPLMITMAVAAGTVHWDKGWHALPESQLTAPWEWRVDLIDDANIRKEKAREILKENGNYSWLTEAGSITILKNGIEFAATYFVMLLVLFFYGAGRYVSLDYWIERAIGRPSENSS